MAAGLGWFFKFAVVVVLRKDPERSAYAHCRCLGRVLI